MRPLRSLLLPLPFLAVLAPATAQLDLHYDGSIPVQRAGVPLDLGWAGGLNSVQVNDVDLNGDGHKDLLLFDRHGDQVTILLNNGSPGTQAYSVTRAYDHVYPFPELHDWVLLRDYNCDGKEDIFSYSLAGFSVYKNISTGSTPAFELVEYRVETNYVTTSGGSVFANLYVAEVDLPGIEDVDGDGDLDVLSFSLLGSYMEYHKNLSMETYGTCDSLKFELRNKCWGFFVENLNNNSVTLNAPCPYNVPAPEIGTGGGPEEAEDGSGAAKAAAHAGSTILPLDLDDDGVKDLLLGDIAYNNLVGLSNGGSVELANMTQEDTLFPSYDVSVDLPLFPGSFYEDVDNDGKRDLVVSPNATSLAQNFRSMWYYTNTGTDAAPVFQKVQENVFQDRMLDFGEGAFPVPFDHDGDGRMDLIVANHGYYAPGTYQGKLALLRNIGTATAPAFSLITDDYMDLSTSGIGLSMYPAFADVDGDGDKDMYIGDLQGRLHFYRNTATGPTAQFVLAQANLVDGAGDTIDVGQFATPVFHDLDGDGKQDLVIGERNGTLSYYRNTGTAAAPTWALLNGELGGVNVAEYWNITGFSVPFIFRNEEGEREMMLGSEAGWLHHYGNIDGNLNGNWTLLDSTFMDLHDGARTGVCLYDFTGDGDLDMVVGNYRGGLSFWRSELPTGTGETLSISGGAFTIAPNPAAAQADLVLNAPPAAGTAWVVRNNLGQEVARAQALAQRTTLPLTGLAEGIYLVRLEGGTTSAAQRLVVTR